MSGLAFTDLRARLVANLGQRAPRLLARADLRAAAVGVVLVPDARGRACFVLTRRPVTFRSHGGQWALPGGRIEMDETAADAALRETHEEIGLVLTADTLIGRLDDYATRSGHLISPFVMWADVVPDAPLRLDPAEVAAAYRVPLAGAGPPAALDLEPLLHLSLPSLPTTVHAPTAALLYQFRELGLRGRDVEVVDVEQPDFAWH